MHGLANFKFLRILFKYLREEEVVADCCEKGNELSALIKSRNSLKQLCDYWLLEEDFWFGVLNHGRNGMRTTAWSTSNLCRLLQISLSFHFFDVTCYRVTSYKQDRQRDIETLSWNHCCSGKTINIIYSDCVSLALGIQHAMRMCHILICDFSGCTIFSHFISWTAWFSKLKKKIVLNMNWAFRFSLQVLSATFLILRRTERDIIKCVYWSSCQVPVILIKC